MPRRSWLLAAALSLAALGGCGQTESDPTLPAPDFNLEKVGGGRLALADLRGQLVLLDFWATWCTPCVQEIPELNALHRERRAQGLAVVGLAVDDLEMEPLTAWLKERGIEYPVARADTELASRYGAEQFPQHVLISREGAVLERLEPGYHSRAELEAVIAPHLDGAGG